VSAVHLLSWHKGQIPSSGPLFASAMLLRPPRTGHLSAWRPPARPPHPPPPPHPGYPPPLVAVTVVTGSNASALFREVPASRFSFRRAVLDTGAKQRDAFTVDQKGSLEAYYETAERHRQTMLETEAAWLRATCTHLVVSDIVPLACVAAAVAGVPCICVTNFSWDFIYSEYLTSAGSEFRKLVWRIGEDYATSLRLLRLPGYVPMPAFRCEEAQHAVCSGPVHNMLSAGRCSIANKNLLTNTMHFSLVY
jgi:hypothetical protein